jgi:hypothetical protein
MWVSWKLTLPPTGSSMQVLVMVGSVHMAALAWMPERRRCSPFDGVAIDGDRGGAGAQWPKPRAKLTTPGRMVWVATILPHHRFGAAGTEVPLAAWVGRADHFEALEREQVRCHEPQEAGLARSWTADDEPVLTSGQPLVGSDGANWGSLWDRHGLLSRWRRI